MISEFPKHSRKSLFADGIRQDITNKLQHRKCVRRVQQINTYLEVRKETTQKTKFNNHLVDIIINNLQLTVTKNTQTAGANERND